MGKRFHWPLATSSFNLWDKIVIAKWLLTEDRYTMGKKVEEFEKKFSEFSGMRALGVSSGSTANQLVFELWKIKNQGINPLVIVPSTTWISSISPAIMANLEVKFCDINLNDFSFDYVMLEKIMEQNKNRKIILWPTALIGFVPDFKILKSLAEKYGADLFLDACENTFSRINGNGESVLATCDITTTSCYFSHQVVAIEFGFVFFKNESDYLLAKMFRNHGMSRSLGKNDPIRVKAESENPKVDPNFLFALNGTNLRPTDVHAMFGLRDFKRIEKSKLMRGVLYHDFYYGLDKTKYYLPKPSKEHCAFCFPVFSYRQNINDIKSKLEDFGVETRPIIGGNLLYQPPFKKYGKPEDFPNSQWLHGHGCYFGLNGDVTPSNLKKVIDVLNAL